MSNKETKQKQSMRMQLVLNELSKVHTEAFEGLNYTSPFELLIATILAAQCTDARVNLVTPTLFEKLPTLDAFIECSVEELENLIRSTGFYKAKAKNIKACCDMLQSRFNGVIPSTLEELTELPGVGRKTANCVLGHCFGEQAVTVDTHVTRLSNLLKFVDTTDAVKIEFHLMEITPKNLWNEINRLFITHGRKVCIARRPKCEVCTISSLCPSSQKQN